MVSKPRGGARVSTAPQEIARLAERVSGQSTRPVICHDGLLAHYQSCSSKRAAKRGSGSKGSVHFLTRYPYWMMHWYAFSSSIEFAPYG